MLGCDTLHIAPSRSHYKQSLPGTPRRRPLSDRHSPSQCCRGRRSIHWTRGRRSAGRPRCCWAGCSARAGWSGEQLRRRRGRCRQPRSKFPPPGSPENKVSRSLRSPPLQSSSPGALSRPGRCLLVPGAGPALTETLSWPECRPGLCRSGGPPASPRGRQRG